MRWSPSSFAALLSAAMFVGVLLMWAESHAEVRDVKFGSIVNAGGQWQFHAASIQSSEGGVWLQTLSPSRSTGTRSKTHANVLGMRVTSGDVMVGGPSAYLHSVAVRVPYWFLACITGMLPLMWMRGVRRQCRWMRSGHCPRCGFDMRITPDSCPECGLVIVRDPFNPDEMEPSFSHLRRAPH